MATLPDAASIDWGNVGAWAAGITTVVVSMGTAAWLAIRKAVQIAATLPAPKTVKEETKIITADTVAMERLAGQIETNNERSLTTHLMMKELTVAIEQNTHQVDKACEAIAEARTEIRELTREIVRSNK